MSNSQEISWLKVQSADNNIIYQTESKNIIQKLKSSSEDKASKLNFPVLNDILDFEIFTSLESDNIFTEEGKQILNYRGFSDDNKNKISVNVIGDIITATIILENKKGFTYQILPIKNKLYSKEIDTSGELDNINLKNDILKDQAITIKKKLLPLNPHWLRWKVSQI